MSGNTDILIKKLADTINESTTKKTSPYDTQAEVRRVEDNTAWVHIPGGVDETPVQLTTNAKPGDTVQVRVSGGQAWLYGNQTAPPTDDTKANEVGDTLKATVVEIDKIIEHVTEIDRLIAQSITVDQLEAGEISAVLINAINLAVSGQIDAARLNVDQVTATQAFISALNTGIINSGAITTNQLRSGSVSADIVNAINMSASTIYASRIIYTDPQTGQSYLVQPANVYAEADPQPTSDTWNNGEGFYIRTGTDPNYTYTEQTGEIFDSTKTYYVINTIETYEKVDGDIIEDLTITADKIVGKSISADKLNIGEYIAFDYRKKLLAAQPTDWATNWRSYYKKGVHDDEYEPVKDATCPTWASDTYYEIDMDSPQMTIGSKESFAVTVDNTQITFWYNWNKVAYINGDRMEIPRSVMLEEMLIGKDKWSWREHDDNLQLKWIGA